METLDEATICRRRKTVKLAILKVVRSFSNLLRLARLGRRRFARRLRSLKRDTANKRIRQKMEETKDATLIFLGDYGDRGEESAEIYY